MGKVLIVFSPYESVVPFGDKTLKVTSDGDSSISEISYFEINKQSFP